MIELVRPTEDHCICAQCPILASITPAIQRNVSPLPYDHFCAVLELGDYDSYHEIAGIQIIQLPRAILINNGGACTQMVVEGTNLDTFFAKSLARTDRRALAA